MGLNLNQEDFTITDSVGNIKFSTERKMPTIISDISGIISLDTVVKDGDTSSIINRKDEYILSTNPLINKDDYIIIPFFKINGGVSDTENTVIAGGGSLLLRVIRQPSTGIYLGSSIMSVEVEEDQLKIVVNNSLDKTGFKNIIGDDIVNVSYRVYYGRFS